MSDNLFQTALQHHQAGRLAQAEALYKQILAQNPDHADVLHLLGVIAHQTGRNDLAVELIGRAIALKPNYSQAYNHLGIALQEKGQLDAAVAAYRKAITLNPKDAQAHTNLGNVLKEQWQLDAAIDAYRRAIALQPNLPEVHNNLGNVLRDKGQWDAAIIAYRKAIALKPGLSEAYSNLGNALKETGQLDDAVAVFRQAISLNPNLPGAYNNFGNALKDKGQLDEALAAYRQAITLKPNYTQAHSNLVFTQYYHPGFDSAAILREARLFDVQHGAALTQAAAPHDNDPDPQRRLRIGYISSEFRNHCQAFFTLPLLEHHDHERFEIFCYLDVSRPDAVTERIKRSADAWRLTRGQSDEEISQIVRGDRIDIFVDLIMHTANGRPLLFARKPAPIQVAYMVPGTTGMSAMDYRFSDPYMDEPGTGDELYSEKTVRLPGMFWCYDPLGDPPEVGPLPALESGRITFGCLNNFCKFQDPSPRLFAQVLAQIRGSRLLLRCPEGESRAILLKKFADLGIAAERIEFVGSQPQSEYFRTYHRIDIGLDTLPYNGHTTSLDSLWMGVPVITLVGSTVVGRVGLSLLSNLGLPQWIARTPEEYLAIAREWAADLPRLAQLRRELRPRMQKSVLMDGPRFAAGMEAAYRQMWIDWCCVKS